MTLSETITNKIRQCDNAGMVAAWENPGNGRRIEVRRSVWWTRQYPDYCARYYTNNHLTECTNGLSLENAGWEVAIWKREQGLES